MNNKVSKLYVVGIGPGNDEQMTLRAQKALSECDVLVGYTRYINLVEKYTEGKEVYKTGMHGEVDRCKKAVEYAKNGATTVVVSSGDSGVYGMAGLVWEIVIHDNLMEQVDVEIVPGVTSANSSASLLGAPLMHDTVNISLSDWLTDFALIEKRLHCAGQGDFVTVLYNPKSKKRPDYINKAQAILLQYKDKKTPVGIVKNGYREGQSVEITTLEHLSACDINMLTTIIIGNAATFVSHNKMITPRGYGV